MERMRSCSFPPLSSEQSPESYIPVIVEEARKGDPDLILLPATPRGKEMAALHRGTTECRPREQLYAMEFDEGSKTLVMERLAYGGAAVHKVTCSARPAMATIPPRTYETAVPEDGATRSCPGTPVTANVCN